MQPMIVACFNHRPAIRRGHNEGERSGQTEHSLRLRQWLLTKGRLLSQITRGIRDQAMKQAGKLL